MRALAARLSRLLEGRRRRLGGIDATGPSLAAVVREEYPLLLVVSALPFLFELPALLHLVAANPAVALEGITRNFRPGVLPGYAYIDPNVGFTTQALGHLDAVDLLRGTMPWWNPYSGTGMPLGAEFQSAPFLPFTLLLALGGGLGVTLEHAALQATAGVGTYLLCRKIDLPSSLAAVGATLYAFSGTFAWFGSNPVLAIPFLPWLLLGVELAIQRTALELPYRWQALAVATTFLLLAGFPETAYLGLLLAALFALVRASALAPGRRWRALASCAAGVVTGCVVAAFSLAPFLEALPEEYIGEHAGGFATAFLPSAGVLQGLVAPYVAGPIFAVPASSRLQILNIVWAYIGGYVTPVLLLLALYGLVARLDRLSVALVAFAVICLGRTYGVRPLLDLFNVLPAAGRVAAFRYANSAWELALLLVALRGLGSPPPTPLRHALAVGTTLFGLGGLVALVASRSPSLAALLDTPQTLPWALWSLIFATVTALAVVASLALLPPVARRGVLGAVMVADALVLFAIPILSNPRGGTPDAELTAYLRATLGDYRVFSLGDLAPNYSAMDRISSLDFNYLPVPADLASWIDRHLEPGFATSPVTLDGIDLPQATSLPWTTSLALFLHGYEALGVRDLVAPTGTDPLQSTLTLPFASNASVAATPLEPGGNLRGELPAFPGSTATITSLSVDVASAPAPGGTLVLRLCRPWGCARGAATSLSATTTIPLGSPLRLGGRGPVTISLAWEGSHSPLELLAAPATGLDYRLLSADASVVRLEPVLSFGLSIAGQARVVYQDAVATVYRLSSAAPIFSSPSRGCTIGRTTTSSAEISCTHPGELVYRETAFPGWSASDGGAPLRVRRDEGLFQVVTVPPGRHVVVFHYSPPHEGAFELASLAGVAALALGSVVPFLLRRRRRTGRHAVAG